MIWRIYLQKARNANARGDVETAAQYLHKMLRFRPNAKAKILAGYYFLKKNRLDEAEAVFENYIMTDKKVNKPPKVRRDGTIIRNRLEIQAKTNCGLLFWKKGDLDQAIEILESLHKKARSTDLLCNLGYLYILKGDLDKALEFNLKAYDFNSLHNGICDNLGYTYYMRGDFESALDIYEEILDHPRKPMFPECYYNYGVVLAHFGEKEEAAKQFKHALQLEFDGFSNVTRSQVEEALKNLS